MFDRVLNMPEVPINLVLAKIWISKSKTVLKINRDWKYNLRDIEDPVKYL